MALTSLYAEFMANPQLNTRTFIPEHGHNLDDLRAFTEAYKKDYFGGKVHVSTYIDRVTIRKLNMTEEQEAKTGSFGVSPTFSQRSLDDQQQAKIHSSNLLFTELETLLNSIPNSRLKSIALTELEKASAIVNKAISRARDVPPGA